MELNNKWFILTKEALYIKNKETSAKFKGKIELENTRVAFNASHPALIDIFGDEKSSTQQFESLSDLEDDCSSVIALQGDFEDINASNPHSSYNSGSSMLKTSVKYHITLVKGIKFTKLTTTCYETFQAWKSHLTKICLTTKLDRDFVVSPIVLQEDSSEEPSSPKLDEIFSDEKSESNSVVNTMKFFNLASSKNSLLYPTVEFTLKESCGQDVRAKIALLSGVNRPSFVEQVYESEPFKISVVASPNCTTEVKKLVNRLFNCQ